MWETFALLIVFYPKNQVEIFFLIMQTCPAKVLHSLQVKKESILSSWIYSVRIKFILLKGKRLKEEKFHNQLFHSLQNEQWVLFNGKDREDMHFLTFLKSKIKISTADVHFDVHVYVAYLSAGDFLIPDSSSSEYPYLIS